MTLPPPCPAGLARLLASGLLSGLLLAAPVLALAQGADGAAPASPASTAANTADAPAVFIEDKDEEAQYIASSPGAEAGAAPALTELQPALDPDREAALREQLRLQVSPAAYLELLQVLAARYSALRPGDEQQQLEQELHALWAQALTDFPGDPLLLLANGDRLRARGSLQAAWEAYARGEQAATRDPRWTARMGGLRQAVQDYPGAVTLYRESLAIRHDAAVVSALAECLRLDGDPAAALEVWNTAIADHPADPALRMAWGRALYGQGSYREALAQYQRGSQLDPRSDLFHNRIALCHFQLGEIEPALAAVRQALALSERPLYYYNLGVGHEELGEYEQAEQWFRAGLAKFPDDTVLAGGYGQFLDSRGRRGEAMAQLSAASGSGGSALDYANLAGLAEEQGDLDSAGEAWQAALAADPTSPVALTAACAFYARNGDNDALVEQVRVSRNRIEPEQFAELLRETGQAYLSARNYDGGAAAFTRIMADHPSVPMVYNQLGLLQHMSGDSAAGLATVKRGIADVNRTTLGSYLETFLTAKLRGAEAALELGPDLVADPEADYGAFELYAGLLLDAGRFVEAESVSAAGLRRYPRRGQLLQLQTRALIGQQRLEDAAALLSSGDHVRLQFSGKARLLGNIYMDMGNYPRAVGAFSNALRALPYDASEFESARALAELAEAQYFAGEYAGARGSATEALALDPRHAPAQVWLGWTLLAQGDVNGAEQAFSEAQPAAGDLETLAWHALGRARSSALAGQRANAFSHWQQAARFAASVDEARLSTAIDTAKAELHF